MALVKKNQKLKPFDPIKYLNRKLNQQIIYGINDLTKIDINDVNWDSVDATWSTNNKGYYIVDGTSN